MVDSRSAEPESATAGLGRHLSIGVADGRAAGSLARNCRDVTR